MTPRCSARGPRRGSTVTAVRASVLAAVLAVVAAAGAAGCSDDGDGPAGPQPGSADAADATLVVDVEHLDAGVDVTWTVTNDGDEPLVVVDGLRGDEAPGEPVHGAYVTGGDGSGQGGGDDVAEISRRVFPVPDDLEGVQQYATRGSQLAPGDALTVVDNVTVPLDEAPAASEGGGDPLPDDPGEAVLCIGVAPADELDTSPAADAPGHVVVPHTEDNAAAQTLLCSDPFEL